MYHPRVPVNSPLSISRDNARTHLRSSADCRVPREKGGGVRTCMLVGCACIAPHTHLVLSRLLSFIMMANHTFLLFAMSMSSFASTAERD